MGNTRPHGVYRFSGGVKHKALRIVVSLFVLIIAGIMGYAVWLSHHYKQIIKDQLPGIVTNSTDSIYHISFSDISVSFYDHRVTITDLKLWPDNEQVQRMREQRRHILSTLSTVSIPSLEAYGIAWGDLVSEKSLDCKSIVVHNLKWLMVCHPNPGDSSFTRDKHKDPKITRVTATVVNFINPDITYHYKGLKEEFYCYMKGGKAELSNWVYNYDEHKDTCSFLYAHSGKVRFESFIFSKPTGRYVIKSPDLDFRTTANSVTLTSVKIKHMVDYDQQNGKEKEIYNLNFPTIELAGFNWYQLVNDAELTVPKVTGESPVIDIQFMRKNAAKNPRMGSYPNQLLLQVGLKTNIEVLNIKKGYFKYTEVTPKGDQGTIIFSNINGQFRNITNIPSAIAQHKSCTAKLEGKFMNKSPMSATFDLSLANNKGGYKVDGYLTDLDGDEVTPQAQVFTIVKVTSFHLNRMDMHIEGDEYYGKGDFTVRYENLKISLFKFDTKERQAKHGLFAFVGSALLLYPYNPMPGKEVRTVTTSFARDTTKGFISTIWQHMFRAAKKTAVREQGIVTLTDGPETGKGEPPKKGILKRLFGKKK